MGRQGLITFSERPVIGAMVTRSRGIEPDRIVIRTLPEDQYEGEVADVQVSFDGSTIATLKKCALADTVCQYFDGREAYRWDHILYDRRWKWRYTTVEGEWNVRKCNGSIDPSTKKSLRELANLCFDSMGETGYDTSALSNSVYPHVNWVRARADLQLAYLCELVGCVPGLRLDDKATVYKLNQGASLPSGGDAVTPEFKAKPTVRPRYLQVVTGPTVFQRKFLLAAVGRDVDGSIHGIDALSYNPGSWSTQWWHSFPDVSQSARHLAFQTVWRWYRIIGFEDGTWNAPEIPTPIIDASQIVLLDHAAEIAIDPESIYRCLDPIVTGKFWPLCDHKITTPKTAVYNGSFKIRPDLSLVEFEYPVIQWIGGYHLEAELYLTAAFNVVPQDNRTVYSQLEQDLGFPETTKARVLKHSELKRVVRVDSVVGAGSYDNVAEVAAEAAEYLSTNAATYQNIYNQDRIYEGLIDVRPDGAIAQVRWRMGYGEPATTRASRHHEFDFATPTYQERRRLNRLAQMADDGEI